MLHRSHERLPTLRQMKWSASCLGLVILSACGSEVNNQQVTTTGYVTLVEAGPSTEHEITVNGDQECPDAFRGTIAIKPGKSWVHIIDEVVVYRSNDLGNAGDLDSWQAARDHFCEYSPD